jgi:hypothetical protein
MGVVVDNIVLVIHFERISLIVTKLYNILKSKSLCICDVESWSLHIIQNEISPKESKKTKICQRSHSTVFNDLSNSTKK